MGRYLFRRHIVMKIYSFDTRDNYSWNVIKDYFSLDNKQMHNEIKTDFKN